jgi:XisI protein
MNSLEQYRVWIKQILTEHSHLKSSYGEIEEVVFFDEVRDHYQLFSVGWENRRRVFGSTIHINIIDGKIWIQHDGTEVGVANELVELGVPKGEIVLAYQPVNGRQLTEFAAG